MSKINRRIFHQQGSFLFAYAEVERLVRSSTTSRADELKILFIKFLICLLTFVCTKKMNRFYKLKSFKSFETSVIPPIPKFSVRIFTTFGDKNAGKVGPR